MKRIIIIILCMIILLASAPPSVSPLVCAASQPSSWAAPEVKTAISLGLVPKQFQGDYSSPVTRAEFAALIIRLLNIWAAKDKGEQLSKLVPNLDFTKFVDTDDKNVLYCAALGIVEGDGKGRFMPNNFIKRQEAAKMLFKTADRLTPIVMEEQLFSTRYRGYASYEMPHTFKDSSLLRSWSRTAVNWCYRRGIMIGVGNNKFAPEQTCTREQSILSVLRLYYCNGMANQLTTVPDADYYPIYEDNTITYLSHWIDSELVTHSVDELGYIASGEKYAFVYDNVGVGVTYGHLINRAGERMLRDLYGTDGFFYKGRVDGSLVELYIHPALPHRKNAPLYFVIDMSSGKIYENTTLDKLLPKNEKISTCKIISEGTGWYALYSSDGRKLSKTYQNALLQVNDTLYLGWVSDSPRTYDILYCDGNTKAKVLRREEFRFNTAVYADDGGLFAIQNTDKQVTLFDTYGDTISIITFYEPVFLLGFANGLVVVETQAQGKIHYYTPGGKDLPVYLTSHKT